MFVVFLGDGDNSYFKVLKLIFTAFLVVWSLNL